MRIVKSLPSSPAVNALAALVSLALLGTSGCSSPGGDGGELPNTDGVIFGDSGVPTDTGGGAADVTPECTTSGDCGGERDLCDPTGTCVECLSKTDCEPTEDCTSAGVCAPASCTPGEKECNGDLLLTCNAQGNAWATTACAGTCVDEACVGCQPGARECQGDAVMQCKADGSEVEQVEVCSGDKQCIDGQCRACYPGTRKCGDADIALRCNMDGGWEFQEDCAATGLSCLQGTCLSPCITDIKSKSNSGCDYWAVDLDNHYLAQDGPFALIVSNLSDKVSTITISKRDSAADQTVEVTRRDVPAGGLEIFNLPQRNMGVAGILWTAYRVQATAPIIAYQFNPLDNVDVFSNDASLLLPANTYGTEYIVVSRFEISGGGPGGQEIPYRGFISVVAVAEQTEVTVTPTIKTQAGASMQTMMPGQSYTYNLEPFQVLNIKSDQPDGDLTGSVITATKEIAVFAGHEAAISSDVCCADHLEQQMFPVQTWGKEYVAAKSFPRLVEPDYWRVVASEDGTTVTFNPAVTTPQTLNRGQFYELKTDQDFVITADKPIMVSQLLASSSEITDPPAYNDCTSDAQCYSTYQCLLVDDGFGGTTNACLPQLCDPATPACLPGHVCTCFDAITCRCTAVGDPALILQPPTAQFRDDYVFLTPNKYADDYINIVAPLDAAVTLDGAALPAGTFHAIAGSSWRVARRRVSDGTHVLTATKPVGVISYGYDRDVSYGYPAGLNLSDQ